MIISCKACGQKNRVREEHLALPARCGKCKASLAPVAEPLDADRELFDAVVQKARVPVLVDFWADWCRPCHMAAPEVKRLAAEMAGRAQSALGVFLHHQGRTDDARKLLADAVARLHRADPHAASARGHLEALDAGEPCGCNDLRQAEEFAKAVDVTGIFLAKLDGTAKGGIVVAIKAATNIPVKFVGVGETPEDIEAFDPEAFVEAMLAE